MVDRWAVATGNWSNTATWNGGTLPSSGDDVFANTFTVTIDQDVTANTLRTINGTGITAGGTFQITTGTRIITVTAGMAATTHGSNSSTPILTISGGTVTLNANLTGGNTSNRHPLDVTGGTVAINGNVQGGTNATARGIVVTGGTTTITGSVTGATGAAVHMTNGVVNVTGDVVAGTAGATTGHGIHLASGSPQVSVTGNVTGGANSYGIYTQAGVARVGGGDLRWGFGGAAPINGDATATTSTEKVMFMLSDLPTVTSADDSAWPVGSGPDVTLGAGTTSSRYLNVGGVATPI